MLHYDLHSKQNKIVIVIFLNVTVVIGEDPPTCCYLLPARCSHSELLAMVAFVWA